MSKSVPIPTHGTNDRPAAVANLRPVLYDPAFEFEAEGEAETTAAIGEEMRKIAEITSKDYGRAVRTVHAKSHGLLTGTLTVAPDLPEIFAQGVFAAPAAFAVVMRFSTNPGDILDDSVSVPRGLALKIVGVEGERLEGSEGATTQDFVMAEGPAFSAPDPAAFLKTLRLLAATTDTPQALKKALSAVLRGAEHVVEAAGAKSPTLISLGGHPNTHVLGGHFSTQVPLLYGRYMAKLFVEPRSSALKALVDAPVDVIGRPDALREAVTAFFSENDGEWDLKAQLLTDPATMPLEDASVVWPQDVSPLVTVATIRVERQDPWTAQKREGIDEAMAFSPWHGIAAHRPLGGVMRARKSNYELSANFRSRFNGCPIHEPAGPGDLPG